MEGWALYAEWLGQRAGRLTRTTPLADLGRLQAEMFRAVRLVVDTGIHSKRWTREQAIAYMVGHTGIPEAEVTTEIERYIVDPGQALRLQGRHARDSRRPASGPRRRSARSGSRGREGLP